VSDEPRRNEMSDVAEIEVVCPGMLEVLSVGKGDLKLTFGGDDPEEIAKARKVIQEMLRKGYGIFVETDKGLTRVKRFSPKRMTYVIVEVADGEPADVPGQAPTRQRRTEERHVPVAGSRAKAIGRTAGG
jgi:hypothetical protein